MRVFVSSIVYNYEKYRQAAKRAIEDLKLEAVLMNGKPAISSTPQQACLDEVAGSDAVIMLLGERYGDIQESGKSPTHEEFDHARKLDKQILVMIQKGIARDSKQEKFLQTEVEHWTNGFFCSYYSNHTELTSHIKAALTQLSMKKLTNPTAILSAVDKLPPVCRERMTNLLVSAPETYRRLVGLLSDPSSRQPGALSRLADNPPAWLSEAGYAAWEAIGDFIAAHEIGNSDKTHRLAIETGSPRRDFYLIRQAMIAAYGQDIPRAHELLAQVWEDYPMMPVARAYIGDDMQAVVHAVQSSGLLESEDADLAVLSTAALVEAYSRLERWESVEQPLQAVIERFPDRAHKLLLALAKCRIGLARSRLWAEAENRNVLCKAVDEALRSRDLLRAWQGPSPQAVAVAADALFHLQGFQQIVDIATIPPQGEAIPSEADSPAVQIKLAEALSMLGRYGEIDNLQLDRSDDPMIAHIRAMQAHGLGDPAALSKIRRAVTRAAASNDKPLLQKSLLLLAQCGEVDESAMSQIPDADADLLRGMAALNREEPVEAARVLTPYHLESPLHAYCLAEALNKTGEPDEALDTLRAAIKHFGAAEWLHQDLVEMLMEHGQIEEAERTAEHALAGSPPLADRQRLRNKLIEIAQSRQDWPKMESLAQAGFQEDPENTRLAWAVVDARCRQVKLQKAREYLIEHDLKPVDDHTARLAIELLSYVEGDALEDDTRRILKIAQQCQNSEQVAGAALMTLMAGEDRLIINEEHSQQISEMLQDYTERYPNSEILREHSFEGPEDFLEMATATQKAQVERTTPLVNMVRYGQLPYGSLAWMRELPYAELLLFLAAEELTAIAVDEAHRESEYDAVMQALGGEVIVDTSVAVLGIRTGLDVTRMGGAFKRVLVPDELALDARRAVYSAKRRGSGTLVYDPGLGHVIHHEFSDQQKADAQATAEHLRDTLNGWRSVKSAHLPRFHTADEDAWEPWDSSLCVAMSRDSALWCDDLALRNLAESLGITVFGTWALYEVLASTESGSWLPSSADMKVRLLRARIADVPITLQELEQATDGNDGPDIAVDLLLRRPSVWVNNETGTPEHSRLRHETSRWFFHCLMTTINGPHHQRVPGLLFAACHGLGIAFGTEAWHILASHAIICAWQAYALSASGDPSQAPQMTAEMVRAARYTAGQLEPVDRPDPIKNITRHLILFLENATDANTAAQTVLWLFSAADPADRQIVTEVVLEER